MMRRVSSQDDLAPSVRLRPASALSAVSAVAGTADNTAAQFAPQVPRWYSATVMMRCARVSHRMHFSAPRTSDNFTRVTRENKC